MPLYIDIVKEVLEEAVDTYAKESGMATEDVLAKIKEHIDHTAKEHETGEPDIEYHDPLCRLGYLYRHAAANATLFQRVLTESRRLGKRLCAAEHQKLRICSVGGGPGTELLGLAKYFLWTGRDSPRKITFDVLDSVLEWAETWMQLSDAVESHLRDSFKKNGKEPPTIAANFLPFDVLDYESYKSYAYQFRQTDIVIFNYLFSENKSRLSDAQAAVQHLAKVVADGCIFVVIDRLERSGDFSDGVIRLFTEAGFSEPKLHQLAGVLDSDEQTSDMGELLYKMLGSPRLKFFTSGFRYPTVFWFTVVKK